jgi:flagellar motor component MotA
MIHEEFIKEYTEIALRALQYSIKSRREGILSLEEELENIVEWEIFIHGLRLAIDGTDKEMIEKILSNKIKLEKDEYIKILKNIQKEAVILIQEGLNHRSLYYVLNSYTDIPLKEDKVFKKLEEFN